MRYDYNHLGFMLRLHSAEDEAVTKFTVASPNGAPGSLCEKLVRVRRCLSIRSIQLS